jgi:hypothetical protein
MVTETDSKHPDARDGPGAARPGSIAGSRASQRIGKGILPLTKTSTLSFFILLSVISAFGMPGCKRLASINTAANPVVGAWFVKDSGAPFPYHMYLFNADGTMQQANPDAGDTQHSDSDGKGVWVAVGDRIKGKWVEVIADRATHKFALRSELSFEFKVNSDAFAGTITERGYDASGTLTEGPTSPTPLEGKRVTLP